MAHFALLWKARTVEKYRLKYETEKINSIAMADIELPKKTVLQKWRHYRFDTQKRISKTFRQLYPEGSSLSNFIMYLRTKQTFTNVLMKAVLGFIGGYVLSYFCFIFFVYQLSISVIYATVLSFIIGILLTVGLAFSHRIRCLVFLLIPQFFSRVGRYTLTCYALILILTGPATNTLKNSEVLSESMACSQEQIKTSLNHLKESTKKPHNNLKDSIKQMIEATKTISAKLKEVMIKINRLILSIVSAIQMNFAWLKSIAIDCNYKLGTPQEHCTKVLKKSIKYCEQVLGAVSSLCDVSYLARATCDGTKAFDAFCGVSEFVDDCILATVRRRLKEFSDRVKAMMYVEVYIHHSYLFSANASRSASQVAAGIVTEIRNRADPLLTWLSWSSCVTSLFLLLIIFRAKYYQHMYETRSRFDNRYVTKELRDLDLKRLREGRETILPLNRREKAKYINITSFRLLPSERMYLSRSVIFMTITTFKLLIHMVADYSLYWVLTTIRYHGSFQTPLYAELPKSEFHVSGYGFISRLIKSILTVLEIPLINTESSPSCLPNPYPPDFRRYSQIGVLIFMLWFFALFEPYGLRLRHVIMSHYRPERARERAMWLYNHILRTRGSFMKFARRRLHREYKYKAETKSTFRTCFYTFLHFDWIRSLLGRFEELKCLLCGITQLKDNFDTQLIRCKSTDCPGTYCSRCFSEIGQLCTICLSPEDYGDISDVSLEKGSSGESSESDDDKNDNMDFRRDSDRILYSEQDDKDYTEDTSLHNKTKNYWRLFSKLKPHDEDNLPLLPYTAHVINESPENCDYKEDKYNKTNAIFSCYFETVLNIEGIPQLYRMDPYIHNENYNSFITPKELYCLRNYSCEVMCLFIKKVQYLTVHAANFSKAKVINALAGVFINKINTSIDEVNKPVLSLLTTLSDKCNLFENNILYCIKIINSLRKAKRCRRNCCKRHHVRKIRIRNIIKTLKRRAPNLNDININNLTYTYCSRGKNRKTDGWNKNNNEDKKKTTKDKSQKSKSRKAKHRTEPHIKCMNRSYRKGIKTLRTVCCLSWNIIKLKATSKHKFHNVKKKLPTYDEKKNYKRRKKEKDEARKVRISAYFFDQEWFKRKCDYFCKKNTFDDATSNPSEDLITYRDLLELKKTPPIFQMATCTSSGILKMAALKNKRSNTDNKTIYKSLKYHYRSKLNITKMALQRFRDRIKRNLPCVAPKPSVVKEYSVDNTNKQVSKEMREQVECINECNEYVPSITSVDSIDEIFEESERNFHGKKNQSSSFSKEILYPNQQHETTGLKSSFNDLSPYNKSPKTSSGVDTTDSSKPTSACHKWRDTTRALSERLVHAGVKTPLKLIKDLCVSLLGSSTDEETPPGRPEKVDKASKGVSALPVVKSFCCQHAEGKSLRNHTTQVGRKSAGVLQWTLENPQRDATMETTQPTCTCATQHHTASKNAGTWLGHHCGELYRAAKEHKWKMAAERPEDPQSAISPRIIPHVYDFNQDNTESSLNTTESSINENLNCCKSESSINSNGTKTDTTICSIATVEYHEERTIKRRRTKTIVVTKANRSTLTDKTKLCDVSTITNDWWSPIVERKERKTEKEISLEKKKGDCMMIEKVHKRMRNKGMTTDGRVVTFKSRTQVIPPGVTDIMSPSRYLLESQRYYNELFSTKFYTPHLYACVAQMQKHQDNDKNNCPTSIRHHTRRGHKNKKYDESYSKKSDSVRMADSIRKRVKPNSFKQNKIFRSTPRSHHGKKLWNKKKHGKYTQDNIEKVPHYFSDDDVCKTNESIEAACNCTNNLG